jgi:hypothetical protein
MAKTTKSNITKKSTATKKCNTIKAPISNEYSVRVNVNSLEVRQTLGASAPVVTTLRKGQIIQIVETRNGWGKVKSNFGWIKLINTTRLY